MPRHLVLVRHGQSEGNVALHASRNDDHSWYEDPEFAGRHSSQWRLTDLGIEQAKAAGEWLRHEFQGGFDRYYVSEYLRAKETAAYLDLPGAVWFSDPYLREREWGALDVMSEAERMARYPDELAKQEAHGPLWRPPNGESVIDVRLRLDRVLDRLHREADGKRVIIVCHGEVMWTFRMALERMSLRHYMELDASKHPFDKINNCQILHYSRVTLPEGTLSPYLGQMRSVCPWDTSISSNEWQPIERRGLTNEDLFAEVGSVERLIASEETRHA